MKVQTIIAPMINPGSLPKEFVQELNRKGIEITVNNLLPEFEELFHFGFIVSEITSNVAMHLLGHLRGHILSQGDNTTIILVGTLPEWRAYFNKDTVHRKAFKDLFATSKMGKFL